MPDFLTYPPSIVSKASVFDAFLRRKISNIKKCKTENTEITANNISVVIPVKNNIKGINRFLKSIVDNVSESDYPREIIIVDNNSDIPLVINSNFPFSVQVYKCLKPGPAAARNLGIENASGDWILFTDSDCIATPSLISGYFSTNAKNIAYSGMVKLIGNDNLTNFYRDQNILVPFAVETDDEIEPCFIITANCLISRSVLIELGKFNETFTMPGGEDTEIGVRLRLAGKIGYNWCSVAQHKFKNCTEDFIKRAIRYGLGNKIIEKVHHLPKHTLIGRYSNPNNPTESNILLSKMWEQAFMWGYEEKSLEDFPMCNFIEKSKV